MSTGFADQTAVITGASSGIGWELARLLAAGRCRVGLIARRVDRLEKLSEEIRQAGGTAAHAAADVGNREQVEAAVRKLREALGPIDLMIANAGVGRPTLCDPINMADIEEMIRVNLLGVVYSFATVMPDMLARRRGHLAAISSLAGYKGLPGESAYCASKAAVNTYLDGLRMHLRDWGITVTTICPGFIRTPMTADNPSPMPWLLEADDAARRIVRALSCRKKVCNFPWQMTLLTHLTRWLPDALLSWAMGDYNAEMANPTPPSDAHFDSRERQVSQRQ
jgi:short-subunit dehydrogenase